MKKSHYTYYSYEEFGRGYIGVRSCDCEPEEDLRYFGSYADKTFQPTQKIILQTYKSREAANEDEAILHEFYQVAVNFHFANLNNANDKFCSTEYLKKSTPEERSENARKANAVMTAEQRSERARKIQASFTPEKRSEIARKRQANKIPEQRSGEAKKGHANRTPEQRSEWARKVNLLKTPEQRSKASRKAHTNKTPEQRSEIARKSQASRTLEQKSEWSRKANSVKFQCTETGYITNAGALSKYQKARGIDTSNRVRIS